MTNLTDLTLSGTFILGGQTVLEKPTAETATGATVTPAVKHGILTLNRAGAITVTLNNPTATTDDFKRLVIVGLQAQANIINCTTFGNGGAGENVATSNAVIGSSLALMAYQGYWYVTGFNEMTIA